MPCRRLWLASPSLRRRSWEQPSHLTSIMQASHASVTVVSFVMWLRQASPSRTTPTTAVLHCVVPLPAGGRGALCPAGPAGTPCLQLPQSLPLPAGSHRIPLRLQAALASAVLLGFLMAETGIAIQHDANHGALSSNNWACYCLGLTLDVVGASSFMWKQQHVVGHHAFTNVDGLDPDLRVNDPDVRRVTRHQPHQPYQVGVDFN